MDATPLLAPRSGVGHYTGRLLAALLALNPGWEHLLFSKRPLLALEPELSRARQVDGYLSQSHWLWLQLVLPWLLRRHQPDLCHFTNELAPLVFDQPFVLTVHDASLYLYSQYHPRIRLWTRTRLLPKVARRAAAIITVSQASRRDLVAVLDLPPERIHVVYEAAPDNFRPVTDPAARLALRHKYRLPDEFLLYIGTKEPRKNLLRLVGALAQLRRDGYPHHLVLAGPNGWLMDQFDEQVAARGQEAVVHHLGYVPTEDLPGLYSLASAFVFPSLYEGFGLPVVEAMACGTPVLTSNNSALAEIAGDAAELVDPAGVDSIAAGLRRILDDGDWRMELSRRGCEQAALYSWRRAAQETAAIYRAVTTSFSS